MKKFIALLSLSLFLSHCSTPHRISDSTSVIHTETTGPSPASPEQIIGKKWQLSDQEKGASDIYLQFEKTDHIVSVSGFGGCNSIGSSADFKGQGGISFRPFISTKKYCENSPEEANYLSLLGEVNRYEVKDNQLFLYKDNLLLMKFIQE